MRGKLTTVGAILLILSACIAGFYLAIASISEFAEVYPSWYDYQSWYPSIPRGYEGTKANVSLGLWASVFVIVLAAGILALKKRRLSFVSIGSAFAAILLIFGIWVVPISPAIFWGFPAVGAVFLGAILVGLSEKGPSVPSALKKRYLPNLAMGLVGIGAFTSLLLTIWGFTAAPEGCLAPLLRRIAAGVAGLACFGLCISDAFLIWRRSRVIYTIPTLALTLPLSLLPPFLVWMPELMGLSLLFIWVPVILATVLVVTSQRGA